MTQGTFELDLVVLAADKDIKLSVEALLLRYSALGIRPIKSQVISHPRRDPGVLKDGHQLLRVHLRTARYCLVMFDRDGCGDRRSRSVIEAQAEANLASNGWSGRCAAIVIDPELEAWVWSRSPHVDAVLGWPSRGRDLRQWLTQQELLRPGQSKPEYPEDALNAALRETRRPASAALFQQLARTVALDQCTDPAFLKFKSVLRQWFSA